MKIIQILREFEFTASGGFAIYFMMCTAFVTIVGMYQLIKSLISLFR